MHLIIPKFSCPVSNRVYYQASGNTGQGAHLHPWQLYPTITRTAPGSAVDLVTCSMRVPQGSLLPLHAGDGLRSLAGPDAVDRQSRSRQYTNPNREVDLIANICFELHAMFDAKCAQADDFQSRTITYRDQLVLNLTCQHFSFRILRACEIGGKRPLG